MSLKKIKKITEEFYKGITISAERLVTDEDAYVEIFKNPSYSELQKLWKEGRGGKYDSFRFILNNSGLFVWDSNILHHEVENELPELYGGGYYGILRVNPYGGINIRLDIGRENLDNDRESDWKEINKFTKQFKKNSNIRKLTDNLGREATVQAEEVL